MGLYEARLAPSMQKSFDHETNIAQGEAAQWKEIFDYDL